MDVTLEQAVALAQRKIQQEIGEAKAVAAQGKALQVEIAKGREVLARLEKAIGVLNQIGDERQQSAQVRIESLVTHGLKTIFGEDLSFHLVQSTKGKAAHVDFVVRSVLASGATVDTPVMDARGGGLAAVVGFLLRLVIMLLTPQRQAPVLFLDEIFAMVSDEYLSRVAEFLRELVDKTEVQIVLVTHQPAFLEVADQAYRFKLVDGTTQILQGAE